MYANRYPELSFVFKKSTRCASGLGLPNGGAYSLLRVEKFLASLCLKNPRAPTVVTSN